MSVDGVTDALGFIVSVVRDIAPRDVVERMLAVQMATTHVAMVRAARSLAGSNRLPQLEANWTNYNKLVRTFTAQVDALKRHRSKGQQVVRVERVNVEPGGQAIVGEVHHAGRGEPAMKGDDNPMDRPNAASRCSARSKRTDEPCRAPAVTGWRVCYFHGAGGGHKAGPAHPA